MKVMGLDNRQYPWTLAGYTVSKDDIRPRSSYHLRCRQILNSIFPTLPICEEVLLPGSGRLRLDFYLPRNGIAIEVNGIQHYKQVGKFHANKSAFIDGQRRDADKRRWCQINNVRLVELKFDGTDEEWSEQIKNG